MEYDIVSSSSKDEAVFYCYVVMNMSKPGQFKYGEYSFEYEPLYVGCGRDRRHKRIQVSTHRIRLLGYSVISKKIKENLDRTEGQKLERYFINLIGRKLLGTGPLLNTVVGGNGFNDGSNWTEERLKSFTENNPMHKPEHRAKLMGSNNPTHRHMDTNCFVVSNPMKNFETASKINKARRAKVDPVKLSKAISEQNKNRIWSPLSKLKIKLAGYKRYNNTSMIKVIEEEIRRLESNDLK